MSSQTKTLSIQSINAQDYKNSKFEHYKYLHNVYQHEIVSFFFAFLVFVSSKFFAVSLHEQLLELLPVPPTWETFLACLIVLDKFGKVFRCSLVTDFMSKMFWLSIVLGCCIIIFDCLINFLFLFFKNDI